MTFDECQEILRQYNEWIAQGRPHIAMPAEMMLRYLPMMHQNFPICTCGANINPFMYVHKRECPVAIQMSGETPDGKVKCPATHEPKKVCVLCKNTNLVDER